MRKKRGKSFIFYLVIACAYILVFSFPLGKETILKPVWYRSFSSRELTYRNPTLAKSEKTVFPVKLAHYFGYIDGEGRVIFWGRRDFYTTMSDKYFINYSKVSENFFVRSRNGNLESGFKAFGYPFFMGNNGRLFIVTTDLTSLSEVDLAGEVKWKRESGSIITSVDVKNGYEAIGALNGRVQLLDRKGRILFSFKDQKSKIPVVNGLALSSNGKYLACISGLEPQRLLIFSRNRREGEKEHYSLYEERDLNSDFRREVFINFSDDDRFLFFEGRGKLNIFDIDTRDFVSIPYAGEVKKVVYSEKPGYFIAVGKSDGKGNLFKLIYPLDIVRVVENLPESVNFLRVKENEIFVGFNDQLLRVDLERL